MSSVNARATVLLLIIAGLTSAGANASSDSCPAYSDIRQPSVNSSVFDIADFAGIWYMIATNEPTQPSFCVCAVNEVDVHKSDGWYAYTNTASCGGANVSIPIKGVLSDYPESPGYLQENFGPFNHTSSTLDPNMIFQAQYDGQIMDLALTYACLGHVPIPPFGKEKFSFNVLSRSNCWSREDVESLISAANASTGGLLDLNNIRISDEDTYASCGMI